MRRNNPVGSVSPIGFGPAHRESDELTSGHKGDMAMSDERYADDYRVAEDEDRSSVAAGTAPAAVELKPMTVAALKAILADAPDDAPIQINPVFAGQEPGENALLTVTQGEVLDTDQWAPRRALGVLAACPQFVFLLADELR